MPGRTRHSTSQSAAQEDAQYIPGLEYNRPLSWRAGKPIPVADLLDRLEALHNELRKLEQEDIESASFTRVAQDLASPNLLAHKDKGVRAFACCCLVDILRLCAPDAPFRLAQFKVKYPNTILYIELADLRNRIFLRLSLTLSFPPSRILQMHIIPNMCMF